MRSSKDEGGRSSRRSSQGTKRGSQGTKEGYEEQNQERSRPSSRAASTDYKRSTSLDEGVVKDTGSIRESDDDTLDMVGEGDQEDGKMIDVDHKEILSLSSGALALQEELEKIKVELPKSPVHSEIFDPSEFPASYKENTQKEKLALSYAENFERQYVHLYHDRKPLFLKPLNECGVEKFVSTTIRATELPYKELWEWDRAAEFVSDYLNYQPLEPPYELPLRLCSPATILKIQKANSFEYSTLLTSLLIGVGYDAYVVSGYAVRETCIMDEMQEICPLLRVKPQVIEEKKKEDMNKYQVKPPKDLRSKFIIKQAKKKKVPTATLR